MPTPCAVSHRYVAHTFIVTKCAEHLTTKVLLSVFGVSTTDDKSPGMKLVHYFHLAVFLQVHGVVNDTIAFVQKVISTELNSATDNPVSFRNNYNYRELL